jgi:regulator of sirC expression with transglutaminase-like and TPR domain
MKRRAFVLAAAALGCRARPPAGRWEFARAALALAERDRPDAGERTERALRELAGIAERVPAASAGVGAARRALRAVLFDELGFAREVTRTDLSFVLLPSVLRQRRGNCVGLGTLYLALALALELPASGVLMPGHFFVRVQEGAAFHNVELLKRGEAMPRDWYDARYPLPSTARRTPYGRSLSEREVLGVLEYDIGNERRRQQRIAEAKAAYARAAALLPDFAPAHASLGTMQHLLGEHAAARASYEQAQELDPGLRGLDQNVSLLRAEANGHAPSAASPSHIAR